ncbi:hypothetical protein DNTS_031602 [Danionella cerebrum]|uniref:Centromere protein Cenp-F N-terminal domain-containing protein n=1 Tax=Danionella cerebrum TaxID=2873325 RepID=A0A553QJJ9_9TELE|nr:hypothetical protein DNTS_031602 [Danionella translucida]
MSWSGDDWTVGLPGHALLKVQQLQAQNEKLNKEKLQRQLQLDNSEAALHKQKQKYEEVRVELAAVHRELGGVREAAQAEERTKERLSHDLQLKTGQVHSLEGQLESAKKLTQNLTLEIKRLEAELEKLQKGNASGESMLFSTPCWNMSSPWDSSGGFRAESEGKPQHARQLHFGDIPKPSAGGAFSPFPQQLHQSPPLRRYVRQSDPSTPSSMFPWEREDSRSTPKGRPASLVLSSDVIKSGDSGEEDALRNQIEELRGHVSELKREAQLESERIKDVESRLTQASREISAKEQSLTQTRDQLNRAQTRISQENDRAQAAEQKVKHLQEELKCQRQNAESSRCNAEQRRKDMEREHQRELLEQQRERQALEKQHQQESSKLNQEIQQARVLHNTLQAQHDKVCLQKQSLERDLEDVKGKLKNTEADLRESQKREAQTEAKLTEALRERETLSVSLGQMKKQEKALQEEVKRLAEELAEAMKLIQDLQAQLAAPPLALSAPHFYSAGESLSSVSFNHDCSPPYIQSAQKKRSTKPGRTQEEKGMKYPSGREPGEGIDSEHIEKFESEETKKCKVVGCTLPGDPLRKNEIDETKQDMGVEDLASILQVEEPSVKTSDATAQKDLKKENAELRDELRDAKYELQKRLDDLETQRRAETEARTKLKQLSRKHSSQTEQQRTKALELKDCLTKLETQLEQEKKESLRLRQTLEKLQNYSEKEMDLEGDSRLKNVLAEMEIKKTVMEEQIMMMKKELQDVQLKLTQEREEREVEKEEDRKQMRREEGLKIAELQEELDSLRKSRSLEEKISKGGPPVAYMHLENHQNSDHYKDCITSFEPICESVNLQNTLMTKETKSRSLKVDQGTQTEQAGDNTSTVEKDTSDSDNTAVLLLEVVRLRSAKERETEKTKLAQVKLEDLQKQVTTQTKHLTQAFESQSKHIENLLREVQDKEFVLQTQAAELIKCHEKISFLEERNTRIDTTPPELCTEISRELSSDSVFSNTSISDHECDDTQLILKKDVSVSQSINQTNTTYSTDKLQVVETSKPNEISHSLKDDSRKHLTQDNTEIERLSKALQEAQNELNVLKAQDSKLLPEREKLLDAQPKPKEFNLNQKHFTEYHAANKQLSISKEGFQNDPLSGAEESGVLLNSKLEIQTQLQQIKMLQDRIQELSEQNRIQAEELKIWNLSTSEDAAVPSTVQKEFELFLHCSPGRSKTHSQTSRTMVHQCMVRDVCGVIDKSDLITVENTVPHKAQLEAREPQRCAEELVFGERMHANNHTLQNYESYNKTPVCTSNILSSNTSPLRSTLQTKLDHNHSESQLIASLSSESQTIAADALVNAHEDLLMSVSISTKSQSDAVDAPETADSQIPIVLCTEPHKTIATIALDNYEHWNQHKAWNSAVEKTITNKTSKGQRLEVSMRTGVTSVSTQTEESRGMDSRDKHSSVHAHTQTDGQQLELEDETKCADSTSPSPTLQSDNLTSQLLLSQVFPMSDPAHLAERIRLNRNRMSAAHDETEYEPYGLPEVVMKGFADIPSGPACPYVLRRGLLGTTAMPLPCREATPPEEDDDIEP